MSSPQIIRIFGFSDCATAAVEAAVSESAALATAIFSQLCILFSKVWGDSAHVDYSNEKTRFQSFLMLMTTQPPFVASS